MADEAEVLFGLAQMVGAMVGSVLPEGHRFVLIVYRGEPSPTGTKWAAGAIMNSEHPAHSIAVLRHTLASMENAGADAQEGSIVVRPGNGNN